MPVWFFVRLPHGGNPGGITVSKTPLLPDGDFTLNEYCWPDVSLWFVEDQEWTADEREAAYQLRKRTKGE